VCACACANSFPPSRGYLCQQSLRPSDELSSRSGGAGAQCVVGTEKLKPCTGVAPCPCAPKCLWEPDVEMTTGEIYEIFMIEFLSVKIFLISQLCFIELTNSEIF